MLTHFFSIHSDAISPCEKWYKVRAMQCHYDVWISYWQNSLTLCMVRRNYPFSMHNVHFKIHVVFPINILRLTDFKKHALFCRGERKNDGEFQQFTVTACVGNCMITSAFRDFWQEWCFKNFQNFMSFHKSRKGTRKFIRLFNILYTQQNYSIAVFPKQLLLHSLTNLCIHR